MPAARPELRFAREWAMAHLDDKDYPWPADVQKRLLQRLLLAMENRFPETPKDRLRDFARRGLAQAVRRARHRVLQQQGRA